MDRFDVAILRQLQADASLTNAELSDRVNLSPSQCSRRRTALEKAGVIRRYRAELDAKRVGFPIEAITRITLTAHSDRAAEEFARVLGGLDEIVEALVVTGVADYIVRIRVRTLDDLADFIHRRLLPLAAVGQVRSELVLRSIKRDAGVPLAALTSVPEHRSSATPASPRPT